VRQIVKAMYPDGVNLRVRRRLRRRIYVNRGPNFITHIDGYDKLKHFGISIHGYSRKVLWLRAAFQRLLQDITFCTLNTLKQ
jgi:hypothetical protein